VASLRTDVEGRPGILYQATFEYVAWGAVEGSRFRKVTRRKKR
jgi:hypothetical protein